MLGLRLTRDRRVRLSPRKAFHDRGHLLHLGFVPGEVSGAEFLPPFQEPLSDVIQAADQRIRTLEQLGGAQSPPPAELCRSGVRPIRYRGGEYAQAQFDLV